MAKLFFTLFLLVGFIPYLGATDKAAPQILYLQLINFISGIFVAYQFQRSDNKQTFFNSINTLPFQAFFFFFIWALISVTAAINKVESFRILTEVYTYLMSFVFLLYFTKKIPRVSTFFINLMTVLCCIEIFTVTLPFLNDLFKEGSFMFRSSSYSGVTGNINIAAFSILVKLPFVAYKILSSKKIFTLINAFLYVTIFFGICSFFTILSTRGAILGSIILGILTIVFFSYRFFINQIGFKILAKRILVIVSFFVLNIFFNGVVNANQGTGNYADRIATVGSTEDGSSQERIRYWKESAYSIFENPVFGIGIGNWKIVGIDKEEDNLTNYVVPYHSHNDFLEITAETGIIGGVLLYLSILIPLFYLFRSFFKKEKSEADNLYFFVFLAITAYLMDAFLNFPFARPIQQISLLSILSFSLWLLRGKGQKIKLIQFNRITKYQSILLVILFPFSVYSAVRLFNSSQEQYYLLGQFNTNTFFIPYDEVMDYETTYPNISSTTIPLKTFQGLYELKEKNNPEKAIELFREAIPSNPYLKINESYMGYAFYKLGNQDSASFYSKIAFEKQPNNPTHFAHYMISLSMAKDTLEIKNAFNKVKKYRNDEIIDKIYYLAMSDLLDKDENRSVIGNANKSLLDSKDDRLKASLYILEFGKDQVFEADFLYKEGLDLFDKKDFVNAADRFKRAAELNPLELPYFENAANAYLQYSNYEKAIEMADYVIDNATKPTGKAHYIKAFVFIEQGNKLRACKLLSVSAGYGFGGATNLSRAYCR